MKVALYLLALVGFAIGQERNSDTVVLVDDRNGPLEDGSYQFTVETSDGARRQEEGSLQGPESFAIRGSYSYTAPDGTVVEVKYVADENGFQPESPLLPQPPVRRNAVPRARQLNARRQAGRQRGGRN